MDIKTYNISSVVMFQPSTYRLSYEQKTLKLSHKESELLEVLCETPNRVVSRNFLQNALWPKQDNAEINLNRHILSLRRKFDSFGMLSIIDTIPRVGYMLNADVVVSSSSSSSSSINEPSPPNIKRILKNLVLIFILIFLSIGPYSKDELSNHFDFSVSKTASIYIPNNVATTYKLNAKHLLKALPPLKDKYNMTMLIGNEAISFIIYKNHYITSLAFLLRDKMKIASEAECAIKTINDKLNSIASNYYYNEFMTTRFYYNCLAKDTWIELKQSTVVIPDNDADATGITTITAIDAKQNDYFSIDISHIIRQTHSIGIDIQIKSVNPFKINRDLIDRSFLAFYLLTKMKGGGDVIKVMKLNNNLFYDDYIGGKLAWSSKGFKIKKH